MNLIQAFFREAPDRVQLFDYGSRTDGQPEYIGHAVKDTAQSADRWLIFKLTYASSDSGANITKIESAGGIWSLRTEYFS